MEDQDRGDRRSAEAIARTETFVSRRHRKVHRTSSLLPIARRERSYGAVDWDAGETGTCVECADVSDFLRRRKTARAEGSHWEGLGRSRGKNCYVFAEDSGSRTVLLWCEDGVPPKQ